MSSSPPFEAACSTLLENRSGSDLFTVEELSQIDPNRLPNHVAIIMDGNRRWAKEENIPVLTGHWEGAELLTQVVRAASELGVETLTVYGFSTENWSRSDEEIEALMELFEVYLIQKREMMMREGIRFDTIGNLEKLPPSVQSAIHQTRSATEQCDKISLILALNYGGRDELCRAIKKILVENQATPIDPNQVTEHFVSQYLDTRLYKDPDLLIRTGGEMRVSNFLLWQISYSELYVTETFWPDFSPHELLKALLEYQLRQRRIGR